MGRRFISVLLGFQLALAQGVPTPMTPSPALAAGAIISGSISFASPADAAYVQYVRLFLNRSGQFPVVLDPDDGTLAFTSPALSDGSYTMQVLTSPSPLVSGWYSRGKPGNFDTSTWSTIVVSGGVITVDGAGSPSFEIAIPKAHAISGTLRTTGGQPVAGAVVIASGNGSAASATSASDGSFALTGLRAGDYTLNLGSLPPGSAYLTGWYGGGATVSSSSSATKFLLRDNAADPTPLTWTLATGGQIAGRITDPSLNPAGGANVSINTLAGEFILSMSVTDGGYYATPGLPAGTYKVGIWSPPNSDLMSGWYAQGATGGYTASPGAATGVIVGSSGTVTVDVQLPRGVRASGRITGPGSVPVANANVALCPAGPSSSSCAYAMTSPTGDYTTGAVLAGDYTMRITAPGGTDFLSGCFVAGGPGSFGYDPDCSPITLSGSGVTGLNVVLPVGVHISGTITGSGGASPAGGWVSVQSVGGGGYANGEIGPDGTYRTGPIGAGTYRINVSPPYGSSLLSGWYRTGVSNGYARDYDAASIVTVASSDIGSVDVRLPIGRTVSGVVRDAGGSPVANVGVTVQSSSENGFTMTDAAGAYTTSAVPDGSYVVQFQTVNDSRLIGGWYRSGSSTVVTERTAATAIALNSTSGNVSGVSVRLIQGASVTGRISGPSAANAAAGAFVFVCPVTSGRCGTASTAADGTYATGGILPGTYRLGVYPSSSSDLLPGYYAAGQSGAYTADWNAASSIAVSGSGTVSNTNVTLPLGHKLSGRIATANGSSAAGFQVSACSASRCAGDTTAADGSYSIRPLGPGTYRLAIAAPDRSRLVGGFFASGASGSFTADPAAGSAISFGTTDQTLPTITVPVGARVTGKILGAASPSPVPVLNSSITVCPASGTGICVWASVDAKGAFTTSALAPGDYVASIGSGSLTYASGWYGSDGTTRYTFRPSQAAPITLTLSDLAIGTITLPAGQMITGRIDQASIASNMWLADTTGWEGIWHSLTLEVAEGPSCTSETVTASTTMPDGTFQIGPVPTGSFRLAVDSGAYDTGSAGNFSSDPYTSWTPVGLDPLAPLAITVPAGTTSSSTRTGSCVTVRPVDSVSGASGTTVTFGSVTTSGTTTATTDPASTTTSSIVDVSTTASYSTGDTNEVCLSYAGLTLPAGSTPRLYHYVDGAWVDITSRVDTLNQLVCGLASSFSPFGIGLPSAPPPNPTVVPRSGGNGSGGGGGAAPAGAPQEIAFLLPSSAATGTTVPLGGTASSRLPVSYEAGPASVCAVSGSTLRLVAPGLCTVTAIQGGDGLAWAPAAPVTRTLVVTTAGPTAVRMSSRIGRTLATATATTLRVARGARIVDRVRAPGSFAGRNVELWWKPTTSSRWRRLVVRRLDKGSQATYTITVTRAASYRWRLPATPRNLVSWSNSVTVKLR